MSGTGHRRGGLTYQQLGQSPRRVASIRNYVNAFGRRPRKRNNNRHARRNMSIRNAREPLVRHRRYVQITDWSEPRMVPRIVRHADMKPLLKNGRKP